MAFNAKNLTYDKSEPAFLQRLKAGYAAQDGRNNVQHARPGKSRLRMGDGDEDDGPVILDESGEVVGKEVYEGMMKGEKVGDADDDDEVGKKEGGEQTAARGESQDRWGGERSETQTVVEIGALKKRKAVKVVSADDDVDGGEEVNPSKARRGDDGNVKSALKAEAKTKEAGTATGTDGSVKPPKKKAKKIKLSFDEPE